MGTDKASLILNGKMLIEIVVKNLQEAGILNIIVSVRDQEQSEWIKEIFNGKIQTVIDSKGKKGIWDVLIFALPRNEIVQIISVDSPWFDRESIKSLTKEWEDNGTKIGVVPWSENGPEPLLMQVKSLEFLELIRNSNPMPLRNFVKSNSFAKIEWENNSKMDSLRNLNYPRDLIF